MAALGSLGAGMTNLDQSTKRDQGRRPLAQQHNVTEGMRPIPIVM